MQQELHPVRSLTIQCLREAFIREEQFMTLILMRFAISAIAVAVFLLVVMPVLNTIFLYMSDGFLDLAEIINEKMKAQEHFLGSLMWMMFLIVCSLWLVVTTTILKIFLKIDVFGVIRSGEEETEM